LYWSRYAVCLLVSNSSNSQSFKLKFSFKGLKNLRIRYATEDATDTELILRPKTTLPLFMSPIIAGQDKYVDPSVKIEDFDEDSEDNVDKTISRWVDAIWKTYDVNADDRLDKAEAWKFCDENLNGMISHVKFLDMWDLMDTDNSGDLSRTELARMVTDLRNGAH